MDPITLLSGLGLGLATNAIYDLLKALPATAVDRQQIEGEVQDCMTLHGISMKAETVIDALAQNGFLSIQGSHLYAAQALAFGSQQGSAVFGNNGTLRTDRTATVAGPGAFVQTQGNAQVRQNPDGSISFHVGDGGKIDSKTPR